LSETKPTCPRCGTPYSYLERAHRGGRTYLYAVHEWRENRRRVRRKCYLGPYGRYVHVEGLLTLNLEGLTGLDLINVIQTALVKLERALTHGDRELSLQTLSQLKSRIETLEELVARADRIPLKSAEA
jgi:hypothetical protein